MILVVGATGQLGSAVVRHALADGQRVRALVRPGSHFELLVDAGAEPILGDLRDRASLIAALEDVDVIVATANAVVPRLGDTCQTVEVDGYDRLLALAAAAGVRKFVFASVPKTPYDDKAALLRAKRHAEATIVASGLDYAILRLAPFTEVWAALAGSRLAERGEDFATVHRPSAFLRRFRRLTAGSVEEHGLMLVNGSPDLRNVFVSVADVAEALVAAAVTDTFNRRTVDFGGPEPLTWHEIADLLSAAADRPVRIRSTPPAVLALMSHVLRPFTTSAAELMELIAVTSRIGTEWDSSSVVDELGIGPLRTVEQVLKEKAALGPA